MWVFKKAILSIGWQWDDFEKVEDSTGAEKSKNMFNKRIVETFLFYLYLSYNLLFILVDQ